MAEAATKVRLWRARTAVVTVVAMVGAFFGFAAVAGAGPGDNYDGPKCPTDTTCTTDAGTASGATQVSSGGSNTADCDFTFGGGVQVCNVDQTNTTGANIVNLKIKGHEKGNATTAKIEINISQTNGSGINKIEGLARIRQVAAGNQNMGITQAQTGNIAGDISQGSVSGDLIIDIETVVHQTASGNGKGGDVVQSQNGGSTSPNIDLTIDQESQSGDLNLDADLTIQQSASGSTKAGDITQVQSSPDGGTALNYTGHTDTGIITKNSTHLEDQSLDADTKLGTYDQQQYGPEIDLWNKLSDPQDTGTAVLTTVQSCLPGGPGCTQSNTQGCVANATGSASCNQSNTQSGTTNNTSNQSCVNNATGGGGCSSTNNGETETCEAPCGYEQSCDDAGCTTNFAPGLTFETCPASSCTEAPEISIAQDETTVLTLGPTDSALQDELDMQNNSFHIGSAALPPLGAGEVYEVVATYDINSWDAYNANTGGNTGYWDGFVIASSQDLYWNLALTDPLSGDADLDVAFEWGGDEFDDGVLDSNVSGGNVTFTLSGSTSATNYLNVGLDTKTLPDSNHQYPSWGTIEIVSVSVVEEPVD